MTGVSAAAGTTLPCWLVFAHMTPTNSHMNRLTGKMVIRFPLTMHVATSPNTMPRDAAAIHLCLLSCSAQMDR